MSDKDLDALPASPSVPTEGHDSAVLELIGREISDAAEVRAYGLYDYSAYPEMEGGLKSHVVRDELTRKSRVVFESDSPGEARREYERLCAVFIAKRAIAIVAEATTASAVGTKATAEVNQNTQVIP